MGKWAKIVENAIEVVALVNTNVWVGLPLKSTPFTTGCQMHLVRIACCRRRAVPSGLRLFHPTVQNIVQATSCRLPLHSVYHPCFTTIMDFMFVAPPPDTPHSLHIRMPRLAHDLFLLSALTSPKTLTSIPLWDIRALPPLKLVAACLSNQDFRVLFRSACQAHHQITPIICLLPVICFKTVSHRIDRRTKDGVDRLLLMKILRVTIFGQSENEGVGLEGLGLLRSYLTIQMFTTIMHLNCTKIIDVL
jgi:hypothetical protein